LPEPLFKTDERIFICQPKSGTHQFLLPDLSRDGFDKSKSRRALLLAQLLKSFSMPESRRALLLAQLLKSFSMPESRRALLLAQ
jgi:hypothetical protein